MFLSHEICHNTVVKGRRLQWLLASVAMLPLCIGPGQWKAWHNRFHHGRTNRPGEDPDTRVDVDLYRRHRLARIMTAFNPGSGHPASALFLSVWFSMQSVIVLFHHSKICGYWSPRRRRLHLLQFWGMASFWVAVLAAVGPLDWLMIHLIPVLVANVILMSYVATNHLLCDDTGATNDPLANSLSVAVPRVIDWLHLNFSYHVEHHVFPQVNAKHAPAIHAALRESFGVRARRIPLARAIALAYRTPPVHLGPRELVDLKSGRVASTLGRCGEDPEELGTVSLPVSLSAADRGAALPDHQPVAHVVRRAATHEGPRPVLGDSGVTQTTASVIEYERPTGRGASPLQLYPDN